MILYTEQARESDIWHCSGRRRSRIWLLQNRLVVEAVFCDYLAYFVTNMALC